MKLLKAVGDYFALDIGTTAVRLVQLKNQGGDSWALHRYGYAPVDSKISVSDSPESQRKLGEVIMTALGQSGISTRDVVVGIPSNKTFATVVDVPKLSEEELAATIKYQAEQFIPMSIDEVKLDYALLGQSLHDPAKAEVLITSVANTYNESRLDMLESLGLNVIASEPDPIALVRAILPEATKSAELLIDVGDVATDLVMTYGTSPRLVRSMPMGLNSLVRSAAQNLSVDDAQARQFILKFGLAQDRLEGQIVRALGGSLDQFVSEINKSTKFFQTRYPHAAVSEMLLTGYGASIPNFSSYLSAKTSLKSVMANPWQKVRVSTGDKDKLQPVAMQFGVALGLAQRKKSL